MADIHDPQTRSRNMAAIKGKNTKPELQIRKALHSHGFRYRLHDSSLPGKPDMVFPKYNAVIFIHGCFWHTHNCTQFKWPKTRQDFWEPKLRRNEANDIKNARTLSEMGWRVCIVWECAIKGRHKRPRQELIVEIAEWLRSDSPKNEIKELT